MSAIQTFSFGTHAVRTVERDGQVWFVGKDVCECLALSNTSKALESLPVDERGITASNTPSGEQNMLIVNEAGLYRLIFKSKKAEAERFKSWVFKEVLPAIRRTGSYGVPAQQKAASAAQVRQAKMSFVNAVIRLEQMGIDVTAIDMTAVRDFGRRVLGVTR
jgi:prophage antirepressor-like protein